MSQSQTNYKHSRTTWSCCRPWALRAQWNYWLLFSTGSIHSTFGFCETWDTVIGEEAPKSVQTQKLLILVSKICGVFISMVLPSNSRRQLWAINGNGFCSLWLSLGLRWTSQQSGRFPMLGTVVSIRSFLGVNIIMPSVVTSFKQCIVVGILNKQKMLTYVFFKHPYLVLFTPSSALSHCITYHLFSVNAFPFWCYPS